MKKILLLVSVISFFFIFTQKVKAQTPTPPPYEVCEGGCPVFSSETGSVPAYPCATSYDDWLKDRTKNFWVKDPEVTALGKAGERSRQFLYWALTHRSIDNHPVLLSIWSLSRNISYFLLIIVAAVMGVGIIIGRRYNFGNRIEISPLITKIGLSFLYATFSAALVLVIIQLSDTLMLFFSETLGVQRLFNIFFLQNPSGTVIQDSEAAYRSFQGCSNISINVLDSVKTSKFLINLTNMTYYFIGVMIIVRKIVLWFLLFVSPFLAVLMPFALIRNVGWVWIGVFFQWVFYGPLFALFLGGLARIWNSATHIPFVFDFSRTHRAEGFVYPTAINILYGGPAQNLSILNSANYVDTFAEYLISLIMLWTVIILPWLLLRIFRDYCCDGIYAMKNILLAMYDQLRNQPQPTPSPSQGTTGTALKIPREVEVPIKLKMETLEEIKKTKTEEIIRSFSLQASKLTDVAHFDTNRQTQETVNRHLNYLANPTAAGTATERQKYMNIRTELLNRAIKEDPVAKHILATISTSKIEQQQRREELVKTVPQAIPFTHVVSIKVKIPKEKVSALNSTLVNSLSTKEDVINNLSRTTQTPAHQIQAVLASLKTNINQPQIQIIPNIIRETGLDKEKIIQIFASIIQTFKTNPELIAEIALKEQLPIDDVIKIIQAQIPIIVEPEKNIEQIISIPPTVAIEDYEQVKKLWINQYERGEVPVTENITSREQWVDHDIVLITNTLNKLYSTEAKIRQEGLNDLGYILPIFLINNMTGEELVVYLKAKLEAAKSVKSMIGKEKEIAEKLRAKADEQLIEVSQPKEEKKAAVMEREIEINEENNSSNS